LPVKKQLGGALTDVERRLLQTDMNDMGPAARARALKMLGTPVVKKTSTTVVVAPKKDAAKLAGAGMTDAEKRMNDIENNEMGQYKKGGTAKHSRADALRAQKYKAAMASRPKREPIVSGGPSSAASLAPLIRRAMAAKATQAAAAPPMEAAAPPMMGAPAMKKGGMKKAEGGSISNFGKAFRDARSTGLKTFEWNGKQYTTDRADDGIYRKAATMVMPKGNNLAPAKAAIAVSDNSVVAPPTPFKTVMQKVGEDNNFGKAFRNARSSGLKTFEWKGKQYAANRADDAIYQDAATMNAPAMKKGGMTDIKQDKALVKKAVHKHEAAMHPGKPMTKLLKGGMPC
jgi:hypothetical protein